MTLRAHTALLLAPLLALGCYSGERPPYIDTEGFDGGVLPHMAASGGDDVLSGACEPGDTHECKKKINEHAGVVNCFCGIQECVDGSWSECGGEGSITSQPAIGSDDESGNGPGASTQSLSQPSTGAPACRNNPCNPYCVGFDELPAEPITPAYGAGSSFEGNPDEWGNAPGGFEKKQNCSAGGDCRTGYPKKCNGNPTNYNPFDGCQADHHCNMATGKCDRNAAGWKWPTSVCPGVDLTAGPSCHNGTNDGFPLCNRGNTAVPAGTKIQSTINNGNWLDLDSCPKNPSGTTCSITLAEPLGAGQCVRVVAGTHCNWNGNAVVYVNSNQAVAECGMPQPSPPTGVSSPGCSNNWSDVKKGSVCQTFATGGYTTKVVRETYHATCPSGTHPQWDRLVFSSTTPGGSTVRFAVRTAPADEPSAFAPATPVTAATAPTTHPANCSAGGPSPCPVDLYTVLGGSPAAHQANLELTVTLAPSSDAQSAPSVDSWQVTYSCPPKE